MQTVSTERSKHRQLTYPDLIRTRIERTLCVDLRPLERDLMEMLRQTEDAAPAEALVFALGEARRAAECVAAILSVVDQFQRRGGHAVA